MVGGFGGSSVAGPSDTVNARHILTPGERGEWDIEAKAGESFIITAESTVFDPVIEIVDAQESVLAENDDVAPGDQRAQVLYRFPTAGKYKVLVKSFQSKAGGQYQFTLRRFVSVSAPPGTTVVPRTGLGPNPWFRFYATKGQPVLVTVDGTLDSELEFYAPTGEEFDVGENYTDGAQRLLVPTVDGEYYVRSTIRVYDAAPIVVTVNTAHKGAAVIGTPAARRKVARGEFDVWTFDAKAGQLIDVDLGVAGRPATIYIYGEGKTATDVNNGFGSGGWDDRMTRIAQHEKNDTSATYLVREAGTYNVAIVPLGDLTYALQIEESRAAVGEGETVHGVIARGEYAVYSFDGAPGQVVSVSAKARSFDAFLYLYSPSGVRVGMSDDANGSLDPTLDTVLDESGRYIVVVFSFGGGGSGEFELTKGSKEPKRADFGRALAGQVAAEASDVWSFEAKAGQNILINVRGTEFQPGFRVYGPDGTLIQSADGDDPLASFRLPVDGRYTVWVRGASTGGRYALWMFDVGN
jgi:hypothetical protein